MDSLLEKVRNGEAITNKDLDFLLPGKGADMEARLEFEEKTGVHLPASVSSTKRVAREYFDKVRAETSALFSIVLYPTRYNKSTIIL